MNRLNSTATRLDDMARVAMQDAFHEAGENLETPYDTMYRLLNGPRLISIIKVGFDLKLFTTLASAGKPLSVEEISQPFGADPLLVGRVVRYIASNRLIDETAKDQFAANKHTVSLADPQIEAALSHAFNISITAYQALPDFLKANDYRNKTGGRCAFQASQNTDLDFFPWVKQHTEYLKAFQQLMAIPRPGEWLDVYQLSDSDLAVSETTEPRKVFVDIGGNIGHQCTRLLAKYPQLAGRIVLEDLPETIAHHAAPEGVQTIAHDFFTEQPVRHAKLYYLRLILHDWEEDKCVEILKNIVPAMAPDSRILIDDLALPDTGTHWWSTSIDVQMYVMHGATERNVSQWAALIDKAGLKMLDVKTYSPVQRNSIIVAALP